MAQPFLALQQPLGSNSCLPTCVRAALISSGYPCTQSEVSEWCLEGPDGCLFFLATQGLRREGFDVVEVRQEEDLLALLEAEDPEPVIVTLLTPESALYAQLDHAVLALSRQRKANGEDLIVYMDPLDGVIHRESRSVFLAYWHSAGDYGFVIR